MRQHVILEVLPINVLHNNKFVEAIIIAIVHNTHNMRITEAQNNMYLSMETGYELTIIRQFKVHDLHCINVVVLRITRNIDRSKAAPASLIDKLIPTLDDTT